MAERKHRAPAVRPGSWRREVWAGWSLPDDVYAGQAAKDDAQTNFEVVGSRYKRVEPELEARLSAQAPLSVRRARSAWICICVSLLITSKISPSVPMTNVVRLTGLMNERRPGVTPYARATEPSLSDSSG